MVRLLGGDGSSIARRMKFVICPCKPMGFASPTIALEGGRNGKADGLIRPALIRDHEVGIHGI